MYPAKLLDSIPDRKLAEFAIRESSTIRQKLAGNCFHPSSASRLIGLDEGFALL
jgi:hypothetical protein